ncbi:MAG: type II secretion system F family protein [Acidimicrobiia bacterium]|nr:type II secretion system F family protein [Acidimicrobiia bacterium]
MDVTRILGALVLFSAALLLFKNLRAGPARPDGGEGAESALIGNVAGSRRQSHLVRSLDKRVRRAGMTGSWSAERLLTAKIVGAAVGGTFGLVVLLASPGRLSFLLFVLLVVGGFFAVDVVLSRRADENRKAVERSLPDVLDQMTICVGAGLGLEGAIARVAATNSEDAFGIELGKVLRDLRVGMTRTEALTALADRVDLAELRTVVRAIIQSDRAGVPVGRVLRVQAEEVRERRRVRAEERAMKMPVKMVFPLVLCVLPALFVVVLGPAILRLSEMNLTGG